MGYLKDKGNLECDIEEESEGMGNLEYEIEHEGKGVGKGDLKGEDDLKYKDEVEGDLKLEIKTLVAREWHVDRLAARAR